MNYRIQIHTLIDDEYQLGEHVRVIGAGIVRNFSSTARLRRALAKVLETLFVLRMPALVTATVKDGF